jgi:restriction system protein
MNKLFRWLLHQGEFGDKCDTYGGFDAELRPFRHRVSHSYTAAKTYFINQKIIRFDYFLQIQKICPDNEMKYTLQLLCEDGIISIGSDGLIRCLLVDSRTLEEKVNDELAKIDNMSVHGYIFEKYTVSLLTLVGFQNAYTTAQSNDYGADVIAEMNGNRYAIQCKCYSKTVGNKAVQEVLASLNYYHANIGAVITNNHFTENAKKLAKANNIQLWDRSMITKWLYQLL